MPRPGFEPGTLDYMTSALPTQLSKQGNNLTHCPSLSIERRGGGGTTIPIPCVRYTMAYH